MKKIILTIALLFSGVAHAGYNISTLNVTDITSLTAGRVSNTDLLHVYRTGTRTAEMLPVTQFLAGGISVTTTAGQSLTALDCGKRVFLRQISGTTVTLPAASESTGCEFEFLVATASTDGSYTIQTAVTQTVFVGGAIEISSTTVGVSTTTANRINFVGASNTIGDYVKMVSDGVKWFFNGQVVKDNALALTTD